MCTLQDDELDISPVEIDEGLVIEDDEISDDDDDENDDVCNSIFPFTELYVSFLNLFWTNILLQMIKVVLLMHTVSELSSQFGFIIGCSSTA